MVRITVPTNSVEEAPEDEEVGDAGAPVAAGPTVVLAAIWANGRADRTRGRFPGADRPSRYFRTRRQHPQKKAPMATMDRT